MKMWVPSTWETEEDVERDLQVMAEYAVFPNEQIDSAACKIPETILKYRKQMAENQQKTLNSDIDESASYIISGRGKGIRDRIIRPGGTVDCHPSDDIELKKQIRQVAGFGYSNEFIEQSIKAKVYDPKTSSDDNSNFKLVSSCSSSSRSSAETTPTKMNKSVNFKRHFNTTNVQFPTLK